MTKLRATFALVGAISVLLLLPHRSPSAQPVDATIQCDIEKNKRTAEDATKELVKLGGRVELYFLQDLRNYVSNDHKAIDKWIADLKGLNEKDFEAKIDAAIPPKSELRRRLEEVKSVAARVAILESKTVNFYHSTITDDDLGYVALLLHAIPHLKKLDLSNTRINGSQLNAFHFHESVLKRLGEKNVPESVLSKLRTLQRYSTEVLTRGQIEKALREPEAEPFGSLILTYAYGGFNCLDSLPELTDLDLSNIVPTEEGVCNFVQVKSINKLWLCGLRLPEAAFDCVLTAYADKPIELYLANAKMTLYKLTDQKVTSLRNKKVSEDVLSRLDPLKTKAFRRTDFEKELTKILKVVKDLSVEVKDKLIVLISDQAETEEDPSWTKDLGRLRKLEGLDLSGLGLTDDGLEILQAVDNSLLKKLNLSGNKLTNQNLEYLDRFRGLQSLELSDNKNITDVGLGKFPKVTNLRQLSLSGTGRPVDGNGTVTDDGVSGLLSRNAGTLVSLNLADTPTLTTASVGAIRQLKYLETLNASGTGIADETLKKIWKKNENKGEKKEDHGWGLIALFTLDVSGTAVTDAGLIDGPMDAPTTGFPKLKTIRSRVGDPKLTSGGISRRNALLWSQNFADSDKPIMPNFAQLFKSP
jgi:hypothetical protein